MNFVETTLPKKAPNVRVPYAEYPKNLTQPDGRIKVVNTEEEEDAAAAQGWSDKPLLLRPAPASAPMSTLAAAQDAYNALKQQFDASVVEFNTKYAALRAKHDKLKDDKDILKMNIDQLEADLAKSKGQIKALLANQAASTSVREPAQNLAISSIQLEATPVQDPQS